MISNNVLLIIHVPFGFFWADTKHTGRATTTLFFGILDLLDATVREIRSAYWYTSSYTPMEIGGRFSIPGAGKCDIPREAVSITPISEHRCTGGPRIWGTRRTQSRLAMAEATRYRE